MDLVADTNTFLAVAMGEPERKGILEVSKDFNLVAPEVLHFEVGNALSAMMKRGTVDSKEALAVWDSLEKIPVDLRRIDIRNALSISAKWNLYAYDAYFLECASSLRLPLLTLDRRMKTVAREMNLRTLEVTG